MKVAPGLACLSNAPFTKPRVSFVNARCTLMTSDCSTSSSADGTISMSKLSAAAVAGRVVLAEAAAPHQHRHAEARGRWRATSWPMCPKPSRPSVWPIRPLALAYSFLFHLPARSSATLSAIRRSIARINAIVSSATATEFLPGQFDT